MRLRTLKTHLKYYFLHRDPELNNCAGTKFRNFPFFYTCHGTEFRNFASVPEPRIKKKRVPEPSAGTQIQVSSIRNSVPEPRSVTAFRNRSGTALKNAHFQKTLLKSKSAKRFQKRYRKLLSRKNAKICPDVLPK